MYSYDEAIELDDLTPSEVEAELQKHGVTLKEFHEENDVRELYTGREVLEFLGY